MPIAWDVFTPWSALAGGLLIGFATSMLWLLNRRIAGISEILGGLLKPVRRDGRWRLAFLTGLVVSPLVCRMFAAMPSPQIDASFGLLIAAGLLVGLGTRYGSGCTSGHGVCGLSRFSLRSLVATLTFMGAGFATVFVTRHLIML